MVRVRVLRLFHRSIALVTAGVTWTSRTASAPWAARAFHSTVIDAAGAIYVIGGGIIGGTHYHDAWVSSDGGAAGLGGYSGVLKGYRRGYSCGAKVVRRGYHGAIWGAQAVLKRCSEGYASGTKGVQKGSYSEGTQGKRVCFVRYGTQGYSRTHTRAHTHTRTRSFSLADSLGNERRRSPHDHKCTGARLPTHTSHPFDSDLV